MRPLRSALLIFSCLAASAAALSETVMNWTQLPPVPAPEGFAAPFLGVAGGGLLLAGGANFAGRPPWAGGTKQWYDTVYFLERPDSAWRVVGHLPGRRAYGVSVTVPAGVICAGGGDERVHSTEVILLSFDSHALRSRPLPPLPKPCAFASGALVGRTLFIAGGIETPSATEALHTLWSLDVEDPAATWRVLPPWPGPGRMLAVAAGAGDTFYLLSGVSLHADARGQPARTYLKDGYAFTAGRGWRRIADLPRAAVAAASPVPSSPDGRVLVLFGDDGTSVQLFGPHHPGFPRSVLGYDPAADRWSELGDAPFSRATVPTTQWQGAWIIANGERIPGVRSDEVWALRFSPTR